MSMILYCGGAPATREELHNLPTPEPLGPRHAPMPHADFVETVLDAVGQRGFRVQGESYGLHRDQLFGLLEVEHEGLADTPGVAYQLGLRASHDRSLPMGLSCGSRVFVCDNLAFSGDMVLHTRQTTNLYHRLPMMLEEMVAQLGSLFEAQAERYEGYRRRRLIQREADSAIVAMGRLGVINWSDLPKVVNQWYAPAHDEHAEDGNSVWRLFNAATEVLKGRSLPQITERTLKLHKICDAA